MRALCRAFDWSSTPLGPIEQWPTALRTSAAIVLGSGFPSILVWGDTLVQIYNDAYIPLIGAKHPSALGQPTHETWPELRAIQEPVFARVYRGETVTISDALYRLDRHHGDPEDAYFTASFVPVPLDGGGVGGSLSTLFETTVQVTMRVSAEERARLDEAERLARETTAAASAYLQRVVEQAPTIINTFRGPEHVFTSANARFREITGLSVDVIGRPVREAQPYLEGTGVFEMLDRAFATGEPFVGTEVVVPVTNGATGEVLERMFSFVYQPVVDDDGCVLGIASIATEVSEQVRARRAAERHAAELEAVIESIPDAVYIGNANGMTQVNRRALEQLGLSSIAALHGPIVELSAAARVRDARTGAPFEPGQSPFVRALAGERTVTDIIVRDRSTGADRILRAAASPIVVDGKLVGAVMVNTDITDQRRGEDALRAAVSSAEQASRAKTEFLAVMSHELRTPLNAIGGYAELLAMGIRGPVTDQQRHDLERIQRSQLHLLGLINEVLNYAKIETGSVRYVIEPVPVRDAILAAESLVAPQAAVKRLTLTVGQCPPELAARADPEKLRQILVNLLSNAVKFTDPSGRIDVTCAQSNGSVHIAIRDTGIGIGSDKLEAIFEPFVQVNPGLTRTAEGTGLGLAISRDLARGMSGDLVVESIPKEGSVFTLTLPRA
ncbi:MAG TPA: ATP-binding protein [Gemmatimonadaceae bacterium]|nr:ATP-binding protein [Gemmatimonadaceae bacterium]